MAKLIGKIDFKPFKEFNSWGELIRYEKAKLEELLGLSEKATVKNPINFLLTFPIADGNAVYVVKKTKPLELLFVPFGDEYSIPDAHMRGLRIEDVISQIKMNDFWKKL